MNSSAERSREALKAIRDDAARRFARCDEHPASAKMRRRSRRGRRASNAPATSSDATRRAYRHARDEERRFLPLRRQPRRGETPPRRCRDRRPRRRHRRRPIIKRKAPESAVKAVDESQKRWKPAGNENVTGIVAISASWPICFATPARDALPGGAASWRSRLA